MDYSKLADEFIEEGAWQGAPVIAVSMFAKWLEEREAAQQSVQADGFSGHANNCVLRSGGYACTCGFAEITRR